MIEIENVSKHFVSRDRDRVAALTNVSISIRRNEFVCLVGPSGCGKSTLLRLVGGLLPVTQGRVVIDGRQVAEPRAETGIVFQSLQTQDFKQILADMEEVVRGTSGDAGTKLESSDDSFGYRWMILRDPEFEDLVVGLNAVGGALETGGYGDRILCAVFPFRDRWFGISGR